MKMTVSVVYFVNENKVKQQFGAKGRKFFKLCPFEVVKMRISNDQLFRNVSFQVLTKSK